MSPKGRGAGARTPGIAELGDVGAAAQGEHADADARQSFEQQHPRMIKFVAVKPAHDQGQEAVYQRIGSKQQHQRRQGGARPDESRQAKQHGDHAAVFPFVEFPLGSGEDQHA